MDPKDIRRKFIINKLGAAIRDIDAFIKEHDLSSSYESDDEILKEIMSYFFTTMCEDPNYTADHLPQRVRDKYMNDPR